MGDPRCAQHLAPRSLRLCGAVAQVPPVPIRHADEQEVGTPPEMLEAKLWSRGCHRLSAESGGQPRRFMVSRSAKLGIDVASCVSQRDVRSPTFVLVCACNGNLFRIDLSSAPTHPIALSPVAPGLTTGSWTLVLCVRSKSGSASPLRGFKAWCVSEETSRTWARAMPTSLQWRLGTRIRANACSIGMACRGGACYGTPAPARSMAPKVHKF